MGRPYLKILIILGNYISGGIIVFLRLNNMCAQRGINMASLRLLPLKDLLTIFALGWSLGTWISRKFPLFPN